MTLSASAAVDLVNPPDAFADYFQGQFPGLRLTYQAKAPTGASFQESSAELLSTPRCM